MPKLKDIFLGLMYRYSQNVAYNRQCWREIEEEYSHPSRFYHTLEHLEAILKEFYLVQSDVREVDSILFAIFYHDIVYHPFQSNNERKSALVFKKRIALTHFSKVAEVMNHIEATKTHNITSDFDTNLFLDLDLLILGSKRRDYEQYCINIRKEYRMIPDFIYRKRRKKLLLRYLSLNVLYKTPHFIDKYEEQARENLMISLRELS